MDVLVSEVFEGVYAVDNFIEYLMEYVVDPGSTLAFHSNFFDESAFNFVTIIIEERIDEAQYHWSDIIHQVHFIRTEQNEFSFLLLQLADDLLVQGWNASLNVVDEDFV